MIVHGIREIDNLFLTGKCWWGILREDRKNVLPLTGIKADEIAEALSFDTNASRTGTSILILDIDIDGLLERAGHHNSIVIGIDFVLNSMAHVFWNFWPKMCENVKINTN